MTVRLLEDALVDQIAAGEVVDRPASVVKELVENSLDAGARSLRIQLKEGGRALVRIVDDGEGMDRHDAVMCLERHATSKIRSFDDLVHVRSLGFRGEAIPSIASVSRFEILTRRHDDEVGTRVRVEGGQVQGVQDAGCAPGTQISVRSLFFNLPVRRAFLRTAPTELGHCVEAITRQALLRPDVDWLVTHDGREVLRASTAPDLASRVQALLGEAGRALRPVDLQDRGVRVHGLVSPADVHQGSGQAVYLYVNGRFVRDPVVRRGVREAYQGIVPRGRHPVVVLHIEVDDEHVDVNVHPAKTEVRFKNPRDVAEVVSTGLREALHRQNITRQTRDDAFGSRTRRPDPAALDLPLQGLAAHPHDDPRFAAAPVAPVEPALPPWLAADVRAPQTSTEPPLERAGVVQVRPPARPEPQGAPAAAPEPVEPEPVEPDRAAQPATRPLEPLALVEQALLLARRGEQILVVDLMALRARAARIALQQGGVPRRLLMPRVVDVGRATERLLAWQDALDGIGLSLSPFGPGTMALKRLPSALVDADWAVLLPQVASLLGETPGPVPNDVIVLLAAADQRPVGDLDEAMSLLAQVGELAPPIARVLTAAGLRSDPR